MAEALAEGGWLPDILLRRGIRHRCGQVLAELASGDVETDLKAKIDFVKQLKQKPIAINTLDANKQHYEVPTEFFQLIMGKYMKYSCSYYSEHTSSLDEAEENMLDLYCKRAELDDNQTVLDLGCGWGSFSLFAAAKYKQSRFVAVSNSTTQKIFIQNRAKQLSLSNISVLTADINDFHIEEKFDRVVSIEMFEHMKNYEKLFAKVCEWLKDNGKLFCHIFAHQRFAYHFKEGDWMADNFFSGGTMPSVDLFLYFQQHLHLENQWVLNGRHYQKTAEDWLKNMDKKEHQGRIKELFANTYGTQDVTKWVNRWRLFWLAVAELFGYAGGQEWVVAHYLFVKTQ